MNLTEISKKTFVNAALAVALTATSLDALTSGGGNQIGDGGNCKGNCTQTGGPNGDVIVGGTEIDATQTLNGNQTANAGFEADKSFNSGATSGSEAGFESDRSFNSGATATNDLDLNNRNANDVDVNNRSANENNLHSTNENDLHNTNENDLRDTNTNDVNNTNNLKGGTQQQGISNNPSFNTTNKNKFMAFTATQGVNAAVIAAASSCNEINNKGFAANAGYMLAFLGLAASHGHHQIADERCQMIAMSMQKMLIDSEQRHKLEFLAQTMEHDLLVKIISAYTTASPEDQAAGILAVASKVVPLEIGYTTMFEAREQAAKALQQSRTGGTPDRLSILQQAFRREEVRDENGNKIGTSSLLNNITQDSYDAWARRNPKIVEQAFHIPTITSGSGDNIIEIIPGDRPGDERRYKASEEARAAEEKKSRNQNEASTSSGYVHKDGWGKNYQP